VDAVLEVRTAPLQVAIAGDLRSALSRSPGAKDLFESLPPSRQRAYLESIKEARLPETRLKPAAQTVERLEALRKAPRGTSRGRPSP